MTRTILIVSADPAVRNELTTPFRPDYLCLSAAGCTDALSELRRRGGTVSAVLLHMTAAADAENLLRQMTQDEGLLPIPVLAVLDSGRAGQQAKALFLGAAGCLSRPIDPQALRALLANLLRLCESAAGGRFSCLDRLTGLSSRTAFFTEAERLIQSHPPGYYVLSCFNIANFKVVNDQYGEKIGDEVLRHVGQCYDRAAKPLGGICCRYMADKFAMLYPARHMHSESILQAHRDAEAPESISQKIQIRIGRCRVDDVTLSVGSLYDRASMAEETLRDRYDIYIAEFQESMREQLLHEQQVVSEMYDALRGRQFETWFQPQYNHATGALIGAEALVRWRHPGDGALISPDAFVPAFERNGFIYELDQFVWEQVCAFLRRRLDEEQSPLPISVNISRKDMLMPNLIDVLTGLVKRYDLPVELLRLEITESAFSQSPEQIVSTIKKLISLGFTVEIDDFGSGYSSLNTLKDVPAQIVKLDMKFLENTENSKRGGNILESVVRMIKWLDTAVIAEGVETKEQADYLKSIGCYYVQGYLYAKPMPLEAYEALENGVKREHKLEALRTVKNLSTNSFWDPNSMDTLIFNSYLGGACILEVRSGRIEVLRANDKFIRVLGSAGMAMTDALKLDWAAYLDEGSRQRFFPALEDSIATGDESDDEYLFLRLPGCAEKTYLRVTLRVIATSRDRRLVYCLIENTTALRQAEEKEKDAERQRQTATDQLHVIMDNVNGSITAVSLSEGCARLLFANEQFYQITGYTREQYRTEVSDIFSLIDPEDRPAFLAAAKSVNDTRRSLSLPYRIVCRDGTVRWLQGNLSAISIPGVDSPAQICVGQDITEQRALERRERETASQMQAILDNVSGGVCAITFSEDSEVRYVFANNEHYAMFGYTREQFQTELPRGMQDIISPEDFPGVCAAARKAAGTGRPTRVEYRARRRDGTEIWVHGRGATCSIEGIDTPVHIIVSIDVTEQREAGEHFRFLNEMAHEILAQPDIEEGIRRMLSRLLDFFGSDRAYIFELSEDARTAANTYESCVQGISSERENLREIPADALRFWLDSFTRRDYLEVSDFDRRDLVRPERAYLKRNRIRSIVAVPLRRAGALIGFIGLDNPRQNRSHFGRLAALGDYLAVMLTRRDYERTLTRHVQLQEQMMQDMPGGYVNMRITPDGTVPVFMNKEFCRLCKMTYQQAMELYAGDAYAGVHPDDAPQAHAALKAAEAGVSTVMLRLRFRSGDGGYVRLQVFYRVTAGADGQRFLNGYYSAAEAQDRTELLRRELLDNLPVGTGLYSYNGTALSVLHLNRRYWELVDREPVRYEDSSFFRALHPEDHGAVMEELAAAIRQNRDFACDARVLYGDGAYRPFHLAARIARQEDGIYSLYAIYTPISQEEVDSLNTLSAALSSIMALTPDYAFVKDRDLRYVCADLSTAEFLGVDSEKALIGKTNRDLLPADLADRCAESERKVLRTGEAQISLEELTPAGGGAPRWNAVSKYPLRDAADRIVGILGISRDITRLYDAAFEMNTLLRVIPSGVFKYTADDKEEFAYISSSFLTQLGYTEKTFREKFRNRFRNLVYEEDRDRVCREIQAQESDGGVGRFDYRIETAGGKLRWFHNEGVRVADREGKIWYYVNVVDITGLREAESKLRLLTDSVSGGLITFESSPGGLRDLYINDGYFRFLGYSREEYRALTAGDPLALVFEEERPAVLESFRALIEGPGQTVACAFRCRLKADGFCWFSMSASLAERHGDTSIINVVLYDITEQKTIEQQLRMREEEYRLAALHSNVSIGRYNIADRTLSIAPKTMDAYNLPTVTENVPYGPAESGLISAGTAVAYTDFFERILRGETDGSVKYQENIGGKWRWLEAHFSTLYSDDGTPVSAIVSFREVTEQIEQEAIYKKWTQSLQDRPASSYTLFRCNLSKNTSLDSAEGALLRPTFPIPDPLSFSDRLRTYTEHQVYAEDRAHYAAALSINTLCANFRRGKHTTVLEYRERLPSGGTRWIQLTVELVEYPGSSDIVAYMLYEDIDQRKRDELQMQSMAETDPLTGLLNRTAFQADVEYRIQHRKAGVCALFMMDVDGFKQVNDSLGHIAGDRMLIGIGQKLRSILRREDLICRIGGDEFTVFLCSVPNREIIEKKAQQICSALQNSIGDGRKMTVSLGIAVGPNDGDTFQALYQKADLALYHVKATGKNGYVFYVPEMEHAQGPRLTAPEPPPRAP